MSSSKAKGLWGALLVVLFFFSLLMIAQPI